MDWNLITQRLLSGKLFATIVVVLVYAYCATNGLLQVDKIQEITLIVLYAYFTKQPTNPTQTPKV